MSVLVVGGLNVDVHARTLAPALLRTSNPGVVTESPGGVGRNIAHVLALLGEPVRLLGAIGDDERGRRLLGQTAAAGVDVAGVCRTAERTGSYLAVLDDAGDLVVGLADMTATDRYAVADLPRDPLAGVDLLVLDANLSGALAGHLLDLAARASVPVVVEPVSVAKARRFAPLLAPARPVLAVTPNADELAALVGRDVADEPGALAAAAGELHDRGVAHVWVRRGAAGSLLSSRAGSAHETHLLTAPSAAVVDVTGAGDAGTAGFVRALAVGERPLAAAAYGQAVSALTAESAATVRTDLTDALVRSRIQESR